MFESVKTSGNIKQEEKQIPKSTILSGELIAKGSNVFMFDNTLMADKKINKTEVKRMMINTDALRLYNKGLEKNKKGNILIGLGVTVAATGVALLGCLPLAEYHGWQDNSYYDYYLDEWVYSGYETRETEEGTLMAFAIPGAILLGTGVAMLIPGIVFKVQGKKHIHESVNMYNRGKSLSSAEFKLNFTGNGIKLALTF